MAGKVLGRGLSATVFGVLSVVGVSADETWLPDESDLFGLCTLYESVQTDDGSWCSAWEVQVNETQFDDDVAANAALKGSSDVWPGALDEYVDEISYKLQFARFDGFAPGEMQNADPVYKRYFMVHTVEKPKYLQRSATGGTNGYKSIDGSIPTRTGDWWPYAWHYCNGVEDANLPWFQDDLSQAMDFKGILDSYQHMFCWGEFSGLSRGWNQGNNELSYSQAGAFLLKSDRYGNDDFTGGYTLQCTGAEDYLPAGFSLSSFGPQTKTLYTTVSTTESFGVTVSETYFPAINHQLFGSLSVGIGTSTSTSNSKTVSPDYNAIESTYATGSGDEKSGHGQWLHVDYYRSRSLMDFIERDDDRIWHSGQSLPQNWYTTPEAGVGYATALWELEGTDYLDAPLQLNYGVMTQFMDARVFPTECEQTYAAILRAPYLVKSILVDFDDIMVANDVPDDEDESLDDTVNAPTFDGIESKTYAGKDEIYAKLLFTDQSTNESWFEIQERMVVREVTGDSDTVGVEIEGEWVTAGVVLSQSALGFENVAGERYSKELSVLERWQTQQSITTDEEMLVASESLYYDHVLQYRIRALSPDGLASDWTEVQSITVQQGISVSSPPDFSPVSQNEGSFYFVGAVIGDIDDDASAIDLEREVVAVPADGFDEYATVRGAKISRWERAQLFEWSDMKDYWTDVTASLYDDASLLAYAFERHYDVMLDKSVFDLEYPDGYETLTRLRVRTIDADGVEGDWSEAQYINYDAIEAPQPEQPDSLSAHIEAYAEDRALVSVSFRDASNIETGYEITRTAAVSSDGENFFHASGYVTQTYRSSRGFESGGTIEIEDVVTENELISYSSDSNLTTLWHDPAYTRYLAYRVRAYNHYGAYDWTDYVYLEIDSISSPQVAPSVKGAVYDSSEDVIEISLVDYTENESKFVVRVEIVDSSGTSWSHQDFEFDNGAAIVGATIGSQMLEVDLSNYADWTAREDYGYDQRIASYDGLRVSARAENDYGSSDWSDSMEIELDFSSPGTPTLESLAWLDEDMLDLSIASASGNETTYEVELTMLFYSSGWTTLHELDAKAGETAVDVTGNPFWGWVKKYPSVSKVRVAVTAINDYGSSGRSNTLYIDIPQ